MKETRPHGKVGGNNDLHGSLKSGQTVWLNFRLFAHEPRMRYSWLLYANPATKITVKYSNVWYGTLSKYQKSFIFTPHCWFWFSMYTYMWENKLHLCKHWGADKELFFFYKWKENKKSDREEWTRTCSQCADIVRGLWGSNEGAPGFIVSHVGKADKILSLFKV